MVISTVRTGINATVSLAKEFAKFGVTINTVSPGPILTPAFERVARGLAEANSWGDDASTETAPCISFHTPADAALDRTNLKEYLETRGAGDLIKAVVDVAYTIEYGLEIDRQSCLNFLLFIHADRRSKFTPFGASDERYHVIGGNQQIPAGLAARLGGQIQYGMKLQRARKTPAGRVELTFRRGSSTVSATVNLSARLVW